MVYCLCVLQTVHDSHFKILILPRCFLFFPFPECSKMRSVKLIPWDFGETPTDTQKRIQIEMVWTNSQPELKPERTICQYSSTIRLPIFFRMHCSTHSAIFLVQIYTIAFTMQSFMRWINESPFENMNCKIIRPANNDGGKNVRSQYFKACARKQMSVWMCVCVCVCVWTKSEAGKKFLVEA